MQLKQKYRKQKRKKSCNKKLVFSILMVEIHATFFAPKVIKKEME